MDKNINYQLVKKILIKGEILVKTGLHIGGTNNSLSIGGIDNAVIRNPINNQPYIPGSSLKGKMRSLLELAYNYITDDKNMGAVKNTGKDDPALITNQLFGNVHSDKQKQRPSKLIVRDAELINPEDLKNTEMPYTEGKTEVVIDRITSTAVPRQLERVPAGAQFRLDLVLNIIKEDGELTANEQELIHNVFKGLQMVQDDYLGGSGSRGSGQVEFKITSVIERDHTYYTNSTKDNDENKIEEYKEKYIPKELQG